METRAKFVLIGAFTLAGLLGIMGFFLWFARVELDRQFAYYDIRFSSVSGLGNASDVRFSGLPVGQVVDVRLSPDRDGTIQVRVEVDAETPVRTDSIATIEAQGVTGVSFVGIGSGTPGAPLLLPTAEVPVPEITAGRSTLQSLSEDAPRLLEQSLQVVEELSDLLGEENKTRLDNILINIEDASSNFAQTLEDFSAVTTTVTEFSEQINRFNATLDTLTGDLTDVLASADSALVSVGELSEQGKGVLTTGAETLEDARAAIARTEAYIDGDLTLATDELRQTAEEMRAQVTALSDEARALMATLGTTGETATARLEESRATLEAANALIARVDAAAGAVGDTAARVDTLLAEEGAPLLSETRAMVADAKSAIQSVARIADDDLPAIMTDIREATANARQVITDVGDSLTGSTGSLDEVLALSRTTLEEANRAFANANDTLAAINGAMETGDRALAAAEEAFTGADRIINDDLPGMIDGLETTLDSLNAAIGRVSEDLPEMSADLRAASASASETFAELRRVTAASAPAVQDFTSKALPLYTRLAQETRTLIANLDRLTNQIERDPARFFLDRGTPEFRR
ncbi:MlaD family protein [Aestuariicoccus sp. MJ-SS9]|uniref:MlaD family protein n=1 Tax=Aestuariicoccus sp. MJ-SS9 TaxID=3079855 RepID=UPI0029156C1C|nr:MlaD family protein [Aestuariicoccus sp. MJ-SS9]MDU8913374.1 MlaD family protein [Aestuariicoccus sp. MJ-SS9]